MDTIFYIVLQKNFESFIHTISPAEMNLNNYSTLKVQSLVEKGFVIGYIRFLQVWNCFLYTCG